MNQHLRPKYHILSLSLEYLHSLDVTVQAKYENQPLLLRHTQDRRGLNQNMRYRANCILSSDHNRIWPGCKKQTCPPISPFNPAWENLLCPLSNCTTNDYAQCICNIPYLKFPKRLAIEDAVFPRCPMIWGRLCNLKTATVERPALNNTLASALSLQPIELHRAACSRDPEDSDTGD